MVRTNGGVIRKTFVAELGSAAPGSEAMYRAKCTRCIPEWMGPVHRLSDEIEYHHGAISPEAALEHARARGIRDVLAHVDRLHHGRL